MLGPAWLGELTASYLFFIQLSSLAHQGPTLGVESSVLIRWWVELWAGPASDFTKSLLH